MNAAEKLSGTEPEDVLFRLQAQCIEQRPVGKDDLAVWVEDDEEVGPGVHRTAEKGIGCEVLGLTLDNRR